MSEDISMNFKMISKYFVFYENFETNLVKTNGKGIFYYNNQ